MNQGKFQRYSNLKPTRLIVCLAILLAIQTQVNANVIGFDFGSTFFKITLVKPGSPFSIVENTATQRKTNSMITITEDSRQFGIDSFMEQTKHPQTTFHQLQRFVGAEYSKDLVDKLRQERFFLNEMAADERGLIGWKIERKFQNGSKIEEIVYTEELIGQLLKYGRQLSEKQSGGTIKDCVITIPSYYTPSQRKMILDAAELAGLSVLQLVHENTAAATMFGIDRLDTEKPVVVLFYNMGGSDTEVSIVRYSTITEQPANKTYEHVEILAEAWDQNLGGNDLDIILTNMLADEFNALKIRQGKPDIRENQKALKRIIKEVVKIKDILSANKHIQVKIGELQDYDSLFTTIERKQFEDKSGDFFDRVMKPVEEVMQKAGLTIDQIDMVELLGGGIRVPKIQEILQQKLQKQELGVHLNGDEAMCFGSAFIGSNSSASFKVRKVYLTQHPQFEISLHITPVDTSKLGQNSESVQSDIDVEEESENSENQATGAMNYERDYTLYKKSDFLGQRKSLSLSYDTNMKIDVYAESDGKKELLTTYTLNSIDDIAKNDIAIKEGSSLPKIHLSFELTRSGLVQLNKAEAKIEETYTVEDRILKTPNKTEETSNENSTEEEAQSESDSEKEQETQQKEKEEEPLKKTKKRPHSFPIYRIDKQFHGLPSLSKEQLQLAKDRLKWFERRDEDKIRTDKAKNDFESVIYSMREWLYEENNIPFVGLTEQEALLQKLQEGEDWLLEGEGEHADYTEYHDRFFDLNRKYNSFKMRKEEYEKRDDSISNARKKINEIQDNVNDLSEKKPWITEEQKKDILERLEETKQWLNENIQKQKDAALNEDPVLRSSDIDFRLQRLISIFTRVSGTAKPKEPKKKDGKKMPKNIKIDNITIDGNEEMDWGDFIKINNGDSDDEDTNTYQQEKDFIPEQEDKANKAGAEEDL